MSEYPSVPQHIGIIMDGNGRWALQRGWPRAAGHQAGVDNIRRILECCVEAGIGCLTLYAFSTENWNRPDPEVSGLLALLGSTIQRQLRDLDRNGVQIRHSGSLERIHPRLQAEVRRAIEATRGNERIILNVAFNYGGRDEIVLAVRRLVAAGIPAAQITAETFRRYLHHPDLPDLDLVIRTGGEFRLSNFMLWQAAYAEYYATATYWPAFSPAHLHEALTEFNRRERRFGRIEGA